MPTLADLNRRFERLQPDQQLWWSGNRIHPKQNMPNYGASIATDTAVAALRLMIDDDAAARRMLAIRYAQDGIDLARMRLVFLAAVPMAEPAAATAVPAAMEGLRLQAPVRRPLVPLNR